MAKSVGHCVHDDVDAQLQGVVGLVGARQRRIQALPARFQINRAVNDLDIAVERNPFQIGLGQAGPGRGGGRSVSRPGEFEDAS